ncbi:aminoglycoside phosphotransferase family protein [Sedimentibacter sp. zth1]|uniref:aminoglycoside phosphotransferase family protein n=1 Tax=Sedimentibacter sp. zth1 TaxID=2816908 RepID=UPI001A91AD54|nr:aminoglycoside phosphotransferase family protein [Sedimentibacter sp. zth1]QSX04658.1 aminoglycoside phosphotransferase family protein [Sedimentibacter sp. zth1]
MKSIYRILKKWGFHKPKIINSYNGNGRRIVCKVVTENGEIILKGIPRDDIEEKVVIGNTKAHEYLGTLKGLAPKLIYLPDGNAYIKDEQYYFYVMEYVSGRQLQETEEDEFALGQSVAKLHEFSDFNYLCSFDSEMQKKVFHEWFSERRFKKEYDAILDSLPNFKEYKQCFIHTDIGPHNALLNKEGKVIFIDLDDSGIGPKYIDLGWPFIMQFVDFNKKTHEMYYKFDLAKAFLHGYYGEKKITADEIDMIWNGAIYMHIAYMQSYGPDAVEDLWEILKYGIEQKEKLFQML